VKVADRESSREAGDSRAVRVLERVAIVVASLLLSVGLIALLSGYFTARDQAGVSGSVVPGQAFRDLGHAHLLPGEPHPAYDSNPPTSGAHVPEPVEHDGTELSDDQLLEALEVGDVVIAYGDRTPRPGLPALVRSIAYSFTPDLAATGDAVILARRPGTVGLIGLAWAHMVRVDSPGDPALRAFAQYWLGRGASRR
jgi:Protein of unknown function (DUF3105)